MKDPTAVLVINSGSSSLKFALLAEGRRLASGLAERLNSPEARLVWEDEGEKNILALPEGSHEGALAQIIDRLNVRQLLAGGLAAVGHRVVHGGEAFVASTVIDDRVLEAIERCSPLAPLHNPANLLGIRTAARLFPGIPQVAVFDTAFHQSLPPQAYLYGVPYELYQDNGVRRYGFHGTSHRYVTRQAAAILRRPLSETALISAHLGNGCSATAVLNGRSVDTSLGMTPLEGLVMGTRSGDVDPSLNLFLHENFGWSLAEITDLLNKKSGLLGVSGLSNDMRTLLEAAGSGHRRARLAIDLFSYRLAKTIAALIVPLGRLDALIFTGGIGEHASPVRQQVVEQLAYLGLSLDASANDNHGRLTGGRIDRGDGPAILVIPTDEERMIAGDCLDLINA